MTEVYLGLGSNLGDRLTNLQHAVELLVERPGIRVTASSRVWETEPVGGPEGQPEYLNAVVRLETEETPLDLLAICQEIERRLGRVRDVRWGPRTIDVDILLYGSVVMDDPRLTIPHPRMLERSFVLLPLLELQPDPVFPDGTRVLGVPFDGGSGRPFAPPLATVG